MKLDLEVTMIDPMKGGYATGAGGEELTLRRILYEALVNLRPPQGGGPMGQQGPSLSSDDKFKSGKLGHAIAQSERMFEISIDDAKFCKDAISATWAPGVIFWALTEIEKAAEVAEEQGGKQDGPGGKAKTTKK